MKYSTVDTTACAWSITPEGRFGNCVKRVSTDNLAVSGYLTIAPLTIAPRSVGADQPAASAASRIKVDDLQNSRGQRGLMHADDLPGAWRATNYHVRVNLNRDGTFSLIQNEGVGEAQRPARPGAE